MRLLSALFWVAFAVFAAQHAYTHPEWWGPLLWGATAFTALICAYLDVLIWRHSRR